MAQNSCGITEYDICRKRGDTHPIQLTIRDSAGAAIDITGFSFLLTVDPEKTPLDAVNNVFQLTGVTTDAAGGVVQFTPTAGQADQPPNVYFYDVQQTDTGSAVRTILEGKFTIEQDVTK